QREHAAHVAGDHRQVLELFGLDARRHLRLRHFDERRFSRDRDGFGDAGERQHEVDRDRRIDGQVHAVADRRLEPGQLRLDVVDAGFEARNKKGALGVGDARAHDAGARVGDRDGHTGKNGITLVEGAPVERAGSLRKRRSDADEHQAQNNRYPMPYTKVREPHICLLSGYRVTDLWSVSVPPAEDTTRLAGPPDILPPQKSLLYAW